MNTRTKLTLILMSILLITGLSACSGSIQMSMDSDVVDAEAAQIADFDLPAGYRADFSASLMGYSMVAYRPDDDHSHLYLIQSENETDGEQLSKMLSELAPGSSDSQSDTVVIETRSIAVRGQETTLIISDGQNSEGFDYRQAIVPFDGNGGPALLAFSQPTNRWDPQVLDNLIASIR